MDYLISKYKFENYKDLYCFLDFTILRKYSLWQYFSIEYKKPLKFFYIFAVLLVRRYSN